MTTKEDGPVALTIRKKITDELDPVLLNIVNESHLHAHHAAMKGNTNTETHFRISIVSDEFANKPLMKRHRMIHGLLDEELKRENGIHALTLDTKTPQEYDAKKLASSK